MGNHDAAGFNEEINVAYYEEVKEYSKCLSHLAIKLKLLKQWTWYER